MLTLTGPPGTGKTRLAIAVAGEIADDFGDGAWFVGLETVRDPEEVIPAIAQVLGVREVSGQPPAETLAVHLAGRQLLLVLDNFEQVLSAGVQVADLLAGCPGLTVLVTSRAPLHLRWEHEFPVSPLALPRRSNVRRTTSNEDEAWQEIVAAPAIQLFAARARAAAPEFDVTAQNAAAVAVICERLDGLPLAIELAAARVKMLLPDAIRDRLTHRLALLTNGSRDLPDRHRTLRAALAWSYDLLEPAEQRLFRRIAIFVGGCTLAAAEAVCDADGDLGLTIFDGVASLVDKHLLWQRPAVDGEPRCDMLETLHEYALEELDASGELMALRLQHARYFMALAEEGEPYLTGSEQTVWLARLDAEHDNLRAALAWALAQGEKELALRLAGAMGRFWLVRGHLSEGRRWLERALVTNGAAPIRQRALGLHATARLAWSQADYPAARAFAEESLALQQELGDKQEIAASLNTLGTIAVRQADYDTARDRFVEALALVHEMGDGWRTAVALYNLGTVAIEQGDYAAARSFYDEGLTLRRALGDTTGIAASLDALGNLANVLGDHGAARALCEEGLALRRELGNPYTIAYSLWNLGMVARYQGDSAAARASIEESLALRRELGDQQGIAWSLNALGVVAQDQGDHATARSCWDESLALSRDLGSTLGIANCLLGLARLARTHAQPERSARLLGAAEALRETIEYVLPPAEHAEYEADVAAVRAVLRAQAFAAAWAAGRALSLDEAIADAFSLDKERGTMTEEPGEGPGTSSVIVPRSSFPDGLTAREAEVLRLVAGGHTSKEIAAQLVLSVHTVERHIANLYTKIGARRRADATAYALLHGLTDRPTP